MATVNESGLLLEQMQENGQNVLRRKIFWVNRWQFPFTTLLPSGAADRHQSVGKKL